MEPVEGDAVEPRRTGVKCGSVTVRVLILGLAEVYTEGRTRSVTKRLIELDDELLARAQRELQTSGISDTVRAALQQAADSAARARQVVWLREGGLEAMAEPAQRADVWR